MSETGAGAGALVVGVTGHRDLRQEDTDLLADAVAKALSFLRRRYPGRELRMLCSLAAGADLLCADAAKHLAVPLLAALPLPLTDYEADFSPEDRLRLLAHCRRAEAVFPAPPIEEPPAEPGQDFFYRQAGIYVAEHCRLLLALWDGGPGKPTGCGTAEAVSFMLEGAYSPREGAALRKTEPGAVIWIRAPRAGAPGKAGERTILGTLPIL